jgi:hypothetical protein
VPGELRISGHVLCPAKRMRPQRSIAVQQSAMTLKGFVSVTDNNPTEGTGSSERERPAPSARDLKRAADDFTEGPNVEFSPWELQAARGETPLEGPRAEDALDWREFLARYEAWKAATVRFEAAVEAMRNGSAEGRAEAQAQALELARLHHAFMESSQPYFRSSRIDD